MKIKHIPALLAVTIALAGALAFKAKKDPLAHLYGITSQSGTGYVVSEELDGEVIDVDYACGSTRTAPCTVSSNNVYTPGQTIPFAQAQVEVAAQIFSDLDASK